MKTQSCLWTLAGILAGGLLVPALCAASPAEVQSFTAPERAPHREYVSVIGYMPVYAVPDRYLFSGDYKMHLSLTELRIDHIADDSRCTRSNRTFMIAASFISPIGNHLGSGTVELPFLSADRLEMSRLAPASVGDYVVHLNNDAQVYHAALGMALTARF